MSNSTKYQKLDQDDAIPLGGVADGNTSFATGPASWTPVLTEFLVRLPVNDGPKLRILLDPSQGIEALKSVVRDKVYQVRFNMKGYRPGSFFLTWVNEVGQILAIVSDEDIRHCVEVSKQRSANPIELTAQFEEEEESHPEHVLYGFGLFFLFILISLYIKTKNRCIANNN
ncbi:hypothetical protein CAAN3_05S00672 [[Candida] anglica]